MKLMLPRTVMVTLRLLPFVVSFIRDWRGFVLFGAPRRLTQREHQRRAENLRDTMGNLGPSFIKGAQVLAMREDMIPRLYAKELRKLQDRVPPFPTREVHGIIRQALGKRTEEVFDDFEATPIAAASLGQVHRASYKGHRVAVKVLRPGVEKMVETDLSAVFFLLFLLSLFIDENLMRSFYAIAQEYRRMIRLEMDFRNERRNADRLRKNFEDQPRVHIPRFHEELTRRQIAVIEFVDGVRIDDKEGMARLGVVIDPFIDLLTDTYLRMAIIHGFIHADPHPGNLLVDAQKRLVILDYGMALEFDEFTRLELLKMVYAVTKKDIDTIVDGFYKLGMVDADINRGILRDAALTLLDIQLTQDLTPKQIQEIAQEILNTFYKFPLRLPNQLVYLFRASTLVEGIAMYYIPRFNSIKRSTPIVKRMLGEIAFKGKKSPKERVFDLAKDAVITAKELMVVIHRLEREQLRLRIHEADIFEVERFFNGFLRRLVAAVGLAATTVAGAIVLTGRVSPILLLCVISAIMIVFIVLAFVPVPRGRPGNPYFK